MNRYEAVGMAIVCAIGFYAGSQHYEEIKQDLKKTNTVVVERIVVKPGGEKIITRTIREQTTHSSTQSKRPVKSDWIMGLSASYNGPKGISPIVTLDVYRRVVLDVYVGLYGRSDGEIGVGFKVNF